MPVRIPTKSWTVDKVLRAWPQSGRVFLRRGMHCIGCPLARFESLDEAAKAYGVNLAHLLRELRGAVISDGAGKEVCIEP